MAAELRQNAAFLSAVLVYNARELKSTSGSRYIASYQIKSRERGGQSLAFGSAFRVVDAHKKGVAVRT